MPMYEFECTDCGQPFEELVRSPQAVKDVCCPTCGSRQVKKCLSRLAAHAGGASAGQVFSQPACAPGGA
jgi:putative FmdB family regulatory protein